MPRPVGKEAYWVKTGLNKSTYRTNQDTLTRRIRSKSDLLVFKWQKNFSKITKVTLVIKVEVKLPKSNHF